MSCPSGNAKQACEQNGCAGVIAPPQGVWADPLAEPLPAEQFQANLKGALHALDAVLNDHPELQGAGVDGHADVQVAFPGGYILIHRIEARWSDPASAGLDETHYGIALFDESGRPVEGLSGFGSNPRSAFWNLTTAAAEELEARAGTPRTRVGDRIIEPFSGCAYDVVDVDNTHVSVRKKGQRKTYLYPKSGFKNLFGRLPPRDEPEMLWWHWKMDARIIGAERARFEYQGKWISGTEYVRRLYDAGYRDLFALPGQAGRYAFCCPENGLDGSEVVMNGDSALFRYLEACPGIQREEGLEMPVRYPYVVDQDTVGQALESGQDVPPEVVMRFPILVARFGI